MSLLNGLNALGTAAQNFGGEGALLTVKSDLAQQAATLADQLATTRESKGRVEAGGIAAQAATIQDQRITARESAGRQEAGNIAATAATLADQRLAARESAGRQEAASLAAEAPTTEIKSARQFAQLSPAEKQAYREEQMTKAGLPSWMIGGDNPAPPTGTVTPVQPAATDQPSANTPAPTTDNTRNESALQGVPGPVASIVKGMVDGRIAPPSSFALSKPYWQGLISKAAEYDPTFDQTSWSGRVATRKDFAAGKSAQAVTALNTALSHAGTLVGDFDKLNNSGGILTPLNAPLNWLEKQFGDDRQTKTQETIDALASEARKVFAASGGGNLTELQEWQKNFPLNGSPTQQRAALTGFVELLDGRLQGLADQYNRGMGRTDDPINLLQPKARAVYQFLTGATPSNAIGYQMGKSPPGTTEPRADPLGIR